uniref:zinc finger protein 185 n=1 Tax=Lonchura striata TaxID=40157 RepID=UPI000B4C2662|nr:zinc finger protein 185 [Lonchura striata domestica]
MMSLGVAKGGLILPTDEDRRRIIRQMKVRTTLRGDKSWIQHHNSDSDEEKSSPLSGQAGRGSPAPKPAAPQQDRSSASKPQSGYLIRGVFTRTIDKSSSTTDSSPSSQAQKKYECVPLSPPEKEADAALQLSSIPCNQPLP